MHAWVYTQGDRAHVQSRFMAPTQPRTTVIMQLRYNVVGSFARHRIYY